MSLKAKLEAVVYAAEEPVTLAQLAALLAEEVLESLAADAAEEAPPAESGEIFPMEPSRPIPAGDADQQGESAEAAPEPANPQEEEKRAAKRRDRQVRNALETTLAELIAEYSVSDRGMEIREIAGGYRMSTKPEYHDAVRGFVKSMKPPLKLSLPALETLAVVAYKQPVTAPEVGEIRGVDSGGVLGSLLGRKLIATAGRKQVIGRPILYKTTKEFLMRFGLKDLADLPSMEEFEKMAAELADTDDAEIGEEAAESVPSNVSAQDAESLQEELPDAEPQAVAHPDAVGDPDAKSGSGSFLDSVEPEEPAERE